MGMVWFSLAHGINQRRKTQQLRQEAIESVNTPDANHPALGLGGRSIELSLSRGLPLDPGAFELAVNDLHDHLLAKDWPTAELLESALWLRSLFDESTTPAKSWTRLESDFANLAE
jgi:hypothetical protein